ncbi:MAG TPA: HAMP domain-containing protein [Candidatus Krumholzibacteria bacterium]|nr:HAMP domain-containing protein [Candidatus Krumholzibacteria bacterium]
MSEHRSSKTHRPRRRFVVNRRYQVQFAILLVIFQFNVGILYQGILQMRVDAIAREAGTLADFTEMNLWNALLPSMLGISVVVALVSYVMGLFFSNSIVGPIPRLRTALQQIARGDFSPRLRFRPGDALEDVADDVNRLAAALDARYGERKDDAETSDEVAATPDPQEGEPVGTHG